MGRERTRKTPRKRDGEGRFVQPSPKVWTCLMASSCKRTRGLGMDCRLRTAPAAPEGVAGQPPPRIPRRATPRAGGEGAWAAGKEGAGSACASSQAPLPPSPPPSLLPSPSACVSPAPSPAQPDAGGSKSPLTTRLQSAVPAAGVRLRRAPAGSGAVPGQAGPEGAAEAKLAQVREGGGRPEGESCRERRGAREAAGPWALCGIYSTRCRRRSRSCGSGMRSSTSWSWSWTRRTN